MTYQISGPDVHAIEQLIKIRNRGFYANGREVTDLFNRVLGKHEAPTNCSSCIRQRINRLEEVLNVWKKETAVENKEVKEEEKDGSTDRSESISKRKARNTKKAAS